MMNNKSAFKIGQVNNFLGGIISYHQIWQLNYQSLDKGKLFERTGRKAIGLSPQLLSWYGCKAAKRISTILSAYFRGNRTAKSSGAIMTYHNKSTYDSSTSIFIIIFFSIIIIFFAESSVVDAFDIVAERSEQWAIEYSSLFSS